MPPTLSQEHSTSSSQVTRSSGRFDAVESPEASVIPMIPFDYRAFQDVFSKQVATKLPPHRAWDCAIDLLPGYKLPKVRVYSLSIPERKAMEEYIKEADQ